MKTKLFFAFIAVILIAIISNFIFERFIVKDFEDYVNGAKEDKLYWVLAGVEGSYSDGKWDMRELHEALHWAIMLGFDVRVTDPHGMEIMSSQRVWAALSSSMKRRMRAIVEMGPGGGTYEAYPLYLEGREIGTLNVRELKRTGAISEKEAIFKKRGKEFLVISFAIAGTGSVILAVLFSLFLSRPLETMKEAVESLAKGNFSVRVNAGSKGDELGRLSESFNFMAEALQREEALRQHLTSNIAHELRTPLAVMKANVEAMIDGVVIDRDEGLENIRVETEKLINLVEGIEDVTKAEASFFSGKDLVDIDLRDFLAGIVAKILPLAAEKNLEMKVISGRSAVVHTDPDKLERIIQNILTNAIKNTFSGGIRIDYGHEKSAFFVEIRDSGTGIPQEKKEMVFKRFYRGDESKGIGLGLAIVKELVDVMGGRIELNSEVGKGSLFRIWLPSEK
jgi:two-component system, OmpR family, sensor histidine kinase BaeS